MDNLITALNATGFVFVKYAWDRAPQGDYGVVSIEDAHDFICDNKHNETGLRVYVDYFTTDATTTPKDTIEAVLNNYPYSLNSVQYESDTRYIHYEWVVGIYA